MGYLNSKPKVNLIQQTLLHEMSVFLATYFGQCPKPTQPPGYWAEKFNIQLLSSIKTNKQTKEWVT